MDLLELFIFTYYIWYTNKIQKHTFVVSISENRLSSDALAWVIDNQCLLIKIIWLSICSQYFLDDKVTKSILRTKKSNMSWFIWDVRVIWSFRHASLLPITRWKSSDISKNSDPHIFVADWSFHHHRCWQVPFRFVVPSIRLPFSVTKRVSDSRYTFAIKIL